jgi:hypothetical protein
MNRAMKILMKSKKLNKLVAGLICGLWVFACSAPVHSQGFEYYYGGPSEDQGQAILQTDDRGYLIAGYSESFGIDGDLDVYLIRTDVDGQEIWSRIYDEGFIEHAYGLDAALDGSYVIVGDIRPSVLDSFNVYLLKVGRNGEFIWSSQFGTSGLEQGFDVKATTDGGYIIAGRRVNPTIGGLDIYVVKADANGGLVWEKTLGGAGDDESRSVVETSDGYVFGGTSVNPVSGSTDIYVFKLDFDGELVWDYYFDYPASFDQGFGMTLASDGSYVVAGHVNFLDIFVAKLSEDGTTEIWSNTFNPGIGGQANDVIEAADGSYVLTGIVETDATNIDLFIAKVNAADGEPIWTHTYGRTPIIDWAESLIERTDGGFAIAGWNGQASQIFVNDVKLVKTDADGRIRNNYIAGKVFADWNEDLIQNFGEPGLEGWIVEASGDNGVWYATTNQNGEFAVLVDTGTYDVKTFVKGANWESAIPLVSGLSFPGAYDTIAATFPMQALYTCPTLLIDVSTDVVVACENSVFTVSYRNEGTAAAAGSEVRLELDTDWTYLSATAPLTSQIGDSIYFFEVGDLAPGARGSFEVTLAANCEAPLGTSFWVKAHITPDEICVPAAGWDGSSVAVYGKCEGDTVVFELRNIGLNNMTETAGYIVIEDEIMGYSTPFTLPSGDAMLVKRYANGSAFRIAANQSANHPGQSAPTVAVEGCMADGITDFSKGMVTMLPEDEANPFIAIDVQESIEAGAAIDLRAYPKGYRGDTIAANVDIEYHIRFQNTTNDTLFWVAIRDTLALEHLNIATLQPGASSHPYRFQAYDQGVVKFVFEGIELPPSATGFVQFKISQVADLPALTEIFNRALLFVGYDETPVQSAQKRHVIGGASFQDFVEIILDAKEPQIPGVNVSVFPNPMSGFSTILVEGKAFNQLNLKVFDAAGRLVRQVQAAGNQITLEKGDLKAGTYFFALEADGRALKTGKVIVQ